MDLRERTIQGFGQAFPDVAPEKISSYVERGEGALPESGRLLLWDANSVQGFVFHTTNASAIRGASRALKELDSELEKGEILGLDPSQILYAGGGGGSAVVAAADAERVQERLHEVFALKTLVGTCSATAVSLGTGSKMFGDRIRAAYRQLERERTVQGSGAEPSVPFFAERCEVCGRRAAAELQKGRLAGPRLECLPCTAYIEKGKLRDEEESGSFDEIAGGKKLLAVLYADGNGVGNAIRSLRSPLQYAAFSKALIEIYEQAFEKVAERFKLRPEEAGKSADLEGTYQLPILGGDDLVAILPGEIAVPFARDLLQELEVQTNAREELKLVDGAALGAAAGVAVGRLGFPVRHLLHEATELKNLAKKRIYAKQCICKERERNSLAFAVIKDGSPRSEGRSSSRWDEEIPPFLLEGGCPYTLAEMQRFSERFRAVQHSTLGRSQLHTLRAQAEAGNAQLRSHVLYQVGRLDSWRKLVGDLAGDPAAVRDKERCMDQILPDYGGSRVFDVTDMIELQGCWKEAES